jgi:hypothetical protein
VKVASALLGHARASDRAEALLRRSAARFAAILYRITRVLGGFLDELEHVGLRPDYELEERMAVHSRLTPG